METQALRYLRTLTWRTTERKLSREPGCRPLPFADSHLVTPARPQQHRLSPVLDSLPVRPSGETHTRNYHVSLTLPLRAGHSLCGLKKKNLEGTRGTKVTSGRQTPNREAGEGQASRGLPAVPGSIAICQLERKPVVPAPRDHLVNEIRKNWGNWSYFKHSFGDLFLDPLLILLQGNHTPAPVPVPTPARGRCWPLS